MPVLTNSRREKFAQEFAKGKNATEAMREAGYTDPRNSTRLTKNDEVRRRVEELQNRGAMRAEVTIGSLVDELEDARQLAIQRKQASAAVAATMGKAKVTGQIVDRAEVGNPGEFGGETAEECAAAIVDALAENIEMYEELLERARRKRAALTQSAAGNGSSRHQYWTARPYLIILDDRRTHAGGNQCGRVRQHVAKANPWPRQGPRRERPNWGLA